MNNQSTQPHRDPSLILTIKGGSSSIKFAIYRVSEPLARTLHGNLSASDLAERS